MLELIFESTTRYLLSNVIPPYFEKKPLEHASPFLDRWEGVRKKAGEMPARTEPIPG